LWQSRKHLQRNQHHGAALQGPVRGADSTFQSDTSRKLRGAVLNRWGVQPQWDNRRDEGRVNVSHANEMTNNYAHITGCTSSQQISFGRNGLLASIHTSTV
jgi:hypothetical protein